MSGNVARYIVIGVFFIFSQFSGYIVSHSGRTFPMIPLLLHKVSILGLGVSLFFSIYPPLKNNQVGIGLQLSILALVLFFIILIATGAVLSAEKLAHAGLRRMHRLIPYAALACTVLVLVLLRKIK
jgi:hypothetical protein